ncbi:response regulator [Patescibacteria group bacterium]|nr:response regulator [Patescibacteria group bacterium]
MSESKKILIMEDEKSIAHAMQLKLEKAGYTVIVAANGSLGIEALKTEKPDLVLLDLVMPVMDGFEVLAKIKDLGIKTSVIVLTNLSQEEDEQKALASGAKKCLVKSDTSISEVVEEVKKII